MGLLYLYKNYLSTINRAGSEVEEAFTSDYSNYWAIKNHGDCFQGKKEVIGNLKKYFAYL